MATSTTEPAASSADMRAPHGSQRRWSAQIAALALAVQALVYLGTILYAVLSVDWTLPTEDLLFHDDAYRAALTTFVLGPVFVVLLAAALLILIRPPLGWTVAQISETALLLVGVQLSFIQVDQTLLLPQALRDFLLLGAILVVIYLNSPEGRLLLVRRADPAPTHG